MSIIKVEQLRKVYGKNIAVDDVSFEVHKGEIFGMVGPNGAGKTTTIECIESLRHPDGGKISVLGLNPHIQSDGYALRERIGIQLQEATLYDRIKVWEAMDLYAALYHKSVNLDSLIESLGLTDKRNSYVVKLSGGQKQRLFIALALINDPELVFLDELTTGLDPQARRVMWKLVRGIQNQGKTVFLTTHYMEEAEYLCNRVLIIDQGRIMALDTPENLIRSIAADSRIIFTVREPSIIEYLKKVKGVKKVEQNEERITVYGQGEELVGEVVNVLTKNKVYFRNLRTEQPTLDDVFLNLTGREIRD
ncbi:MAG: ABC transporter ATP-binding protein [Candidatus Caldatribacteriota bacterium]|nr:ABC transporter ATP-binding protein [Candidatus Caldatribacteriota bacterium]